MNAAIQTIALLFLCTETTVAVIWVALQSCVSCHMPLRNWILMFPLIKLLLWFLAHTLILGSAELDWPESDSFMNAAISTCNSWNIQLRNTNAVHVSNMDNHRYDRFSMLDPLSSPLRGSSMLDWDMIWQCYCTWCMHGWIRISCSSTSDTTVS